MKTIRLFAVTAFVVSLTAAVASGDETEIARLDALIESYNHFFDEQLRLNAEQQILDAQNRSLLLRGARDQRELKEGDDDDGSTRSDGYCDPATLCRSDCNTANTLCMGQAARIAGNCRDAVNAHYDCGPLNLSCNTKHANALGYCASQFLNNSIRCNPNAATQCLNCCSMNPTAMCTQAFDNVSLDESLPDMD